MIAGDEKRHFIVEVTILFALLHFDA